MDSHGVSVIIPTFNRAFSLARSIDSVLGQSYTDIEVIIVDDASTDNSFDVIQPYLDDLRVRYVRLKSNKGVQAARNAGIKNALGDYIAFLDSDDEWLPEKLALQIEKLKQSGEPHVVHGQCWVYNEESGEKVLDHVPALSGYVYKELLAAPGPLLQCMLVPRCFLERIGFLDERVPAWQEWDTSIALARYFPFLFCSEPLAIRHLHSGPSEGRTAKGVEGRRYIVHKYKNEILKHCGRRTLSRHYYSIGARYIDLASHKKAYRWLFKALFYDPSDRYALGLLIRLFAEQSILSRTKRITNVTK